jgi:hypothetical protein
MYKVITTVVCFLVCTAIGYMIGMQMSKNNPEVYTYGVIPGEDGLLTFSVDEDSLAYVTFVESGDTFALDALNRAEFDSLVRILYKDTLFKDSIK